jgi:hypothetical protein
MMESQPIERFVSGIFAAFAEAKAEGAENPVVVRKLRTILRECGFKAARRTVLQALQEAFGGHGLYTEPELTERGVRVDDRIHLAAGPFPPDALFFRREKDLQRFVDANIGTGVLRHLRRPSMEYQLPSKHRIDLLCEERLPNGSSALVAIELKREESTREVAVQLIDYIDELRRLNPGREVRGVLSRGGRIALEAPSFDAIRTTTSSGTATVSSLSP